MPAPQSFSNHARYDPLYHFVIIPILVLNIVYNLYVAIQLWPAARLIGTWSVVMAIVFLLMADRFRAHALKAQDRVICLEERLRLAALLPPAEHSKISQLTPSQLIALRFASNAELPSLTLRAVDQELDAKTIKQSVVEWRADHHRV